MGLIKEKTGITGKVRIIQTKAGTDEVIAVSPWSKNMVMRGVDTGIDVILDRLVGVATYTLNLNYADIGTGTNAPALTDTQLQTPTARALRVTGSVTTNVATLRFFFADGALSNATYNEFATFMDGTATVSTGKIFNRVLFSSPYVKTAGVDTTIEVSFTIT